MAAVKPRVLIIDPDAATIQYLVQALKKSGYEVYAATGGKEGLITAYRERPHILIVDPILTDFSSTELIRKLRSIPNADHRKFIAFSSLQDPTDIQQSLDMGFDHYIAKEANALSNLLSKVQDVVEQMSAVLGEDEVTGKSEPTRRATEPVVEEKDGKTIVVLSANGGSGASSLCANIAAAISRRTSECTIAVVDLVLPLGSIASIVGYEEELNIVEVSKMSGHEASVFFFQQHLPEINEWGFCLLAGAADPEQSMSLDIRHIPTLIDTLKRSFDYVLIDLGRSLSRISLPLILSADQVLMVIGMDTSSVDLTGKVWNYLLNQGLTKRQVYPIINRSVGHEGISKSDTETFLDIMIPNAIPYTHSNFSLANNQHLPYMTKFPDDSATLALIQAADEIKMRLENTAGSFAVFE